MGGIAFIIYSNNQNIGSDFLKSFMKIKHRGTYNSTFETESTVDIAAASTNIVQSQRIASILSKSQLASYIQHSFVYGYHRMAVTDMSHDAMQPFNDPIIHKISKFPELRMRPSRKMLCDGTIYGTTNEYNFTDRDLQSNSDVEVILPLYIRNTEQGLDSESAFLKTLDELEGKFGLVITENVNTFQLDALNTFVARDHFGIKPLYYITNNQNLWMFVSEIKAIPDYIINNKSYMIKSMPPGSYWSFKTKEVKKYYSLRPYMDLNKCLYNQTDPDSIDSIYRNTVNLLTQSTIKRYNNTLLPIGFLLSGGFDSSILVSIVANLQQQQASKIHLFTVGDSLGSETPLDTDYANQFIKFLETTFPQLEFEHHIVYINEIEILVSDIRDIIYHLETYDAMTIRQAIPMYYLLKYIREKTDIRVLLTGDGLDELCSLYDHLDDTQFQKESVNTMSQMCYYDIQRADRIASAFNLELRFPYLDKSFVEYILSIHPKLKRSQIYDNKKDPIDKYIIRKSFSSDLGTVYLPDEILWREKSVFTNALTNFELRINNFFQNILTDSQFNLALNKLIFTPGIDKTKLPSTKEHIYYRNIFDNLFPNRSYLVRSRE
jgi:asparagine synthase (glutamine-hydrolysing)